MSKAKWWVDNFLKKDTTILLNDPTKPKKRQAPCSKCTHGIKIKYDYESFFGPAFRCQNFNYPDKEQWCVGFEKQKKDHILLEIEDIKYS